MSNRRLSKLSQMLIDEVSLVDRGGNQHADLLIAKNDEGEEETSLFSEIVHKAFGESETEENEDGNILDMSETPEGEEPVDKMGVPGMQPGGVPGAAAPGVPAQAPQAQLPPEVVAYIQQLEQLVAQLQGQGSGQENNVGGNQNPFGKSEDLEDEDIEFLQELAKNLEDEDVREAISKASEMVEKAQQRAEAAETIAKEEREIRLNNEWVEKAKAFTALPIDPAEFGPVLRKLHDELEEAEFESLSKALRASESVVNTNLFGELGKRGQDGFEVVSKVDAKAEEIRKDNADMSMEQARTVVLEQNPELYDEYLSEHPSR